MLVRAGDAVVVIGGGAGTLAELATAWSLKKPILAVGGLTGVSGAYAGRRVDDRGGVDRVVHEVADEISIVALLKDLGVVKTS